ncbi:hypothetical protein GZH46_01623 [Fragariocoptes setiger]|uniref:Uncharacterized protein n=1 Tax=Fragariocoptes setiger TaxID=1670756 RepID=A0ABQ7S8T4_9ACAR|nr:hypothetical protein GZH46_01623 [Fragariocoptes setiger]
MAQHSNGLFLLCISIVFKVLIVLICFLPNDSEQRTLRKASFGEDHTCFASKTNNQTTGVPLTYSCPRPNESEKKIYCCIKDKCCDYKEFQWQQERLFKMTHATTPGFGAKGGLGNILRGILITIMVIIVVLITLCCCCLLLMCRKRHTLLNPPLPSHPAPNFPGPSPYAPPEQPYEAYQWPPTSSPPRSTRIR